MDSPCLCFIIYALFWVGVIVLIVWFSIWLDDRNHRHMEVTVDAASLTRFDLDASNNNTLVYNLTLNVSIRNGNKATVYYTKLEARAYYDGDEFGFTSIPPFTQWQKTTAVVYPAFQGQVRNTSDSAVGKFDWEKREGIYGIDVKLNANIRMEWDETNYDGDTFTSSNGHAPEVSCSLKVPMAVNGSSPAGFNATRCGVHL